MKRSSNYSIILLVFAVLLAGCVKEEGWSSGGTIRFGARSLGGLMTRTEYSDFVEGSGSVSRKQMIKWVSGDTLRVACAQVSDSRKYADYITTNVEKVGSEYRASMIAASSSSLHWGSSSTHVFYGVYPSPAVKSGDILTDAGVLTGTIPEIQPVLKYSAAPTCNDSTHTVASPDMKNQYMVSKGTVENRSFAGKEVFMNYTAITTAIEFTIVNKMSADLQIDSIVVLDEREAVADSLSGTFTLSLSGLSENGSIQYPEVSSVSKPKNRATVKFADSQGSKKVAVGDTLTFTMFFLPKDDLDQLSFKIITSGGKYIKTQLKTDASTWITFARCKKHFIKGLFVNEGAKWSLNLSPYVDNWGTGTNIDQALKEPDLGSLPNLISWTAGEGATLNMEESAGFLFALENSSDATQTFSTAPSATGTSRTINITSTKDGDSQNWKIKSVGGVTVNGTSHTAADGDLKVEIADGKLKVTDLRKLISYGDHDHWTTFDGKSSNISTWTGDWSSSTSTSPVDLSKYDFASDNKTAHSMTTANCYVIHHAGTYKIPLVYGNAVDGGNTNSDSYMPTIASGGTNGLTPFVNHLGYGIFDPYIENNTDDGLPKANITSGPQAQRRSNNFLTAAKAELVWSEKSNLITVASDIKGTKKTQGDNSYSGGNYDSEDVRWIEFSVSNTNICQCNAIIAVKDSNGKIMWSWHIWITNNPALGEQAIAVTNNAGTVSSFLAAPAIGWIDSDFYEKKDNVTIVLEQDDSGEEITITAKQLEYINNSGHGCCYQFGRKDPMRYNVTTDTDASTTTVALNASILNPNTFYTHWKSGGYYNLWTGKESKNYKLEALTGNNTDAEEGVNMIKTIYDPSPAGYKVPSTKAFTGFTKEGKKCGSTGLSLYPLSDSNISGSYHNGWDFYTSSSKSSTIYFPKVYNRESDGSPLGFAMGRYFTSTPNSDSDNGAFEFQFQGKYVYPMTEKSSRANALCVRPITE